MRVRLDTVRVKFVLAVTLGVCAALIAIVGLVGALGMSALSDDMRLMYSNDTLPIANLAAVESSALRIRLGLMRLPSMQNPADTKAMIERLATTQKSMAAAWRAYYPGQATQPAEREVAARIDAAISAFTVQAERAATINAGDSVVSRPLLDALADTSQGVYNGADRIIAIKSAHVQRKADESAARFQRMLLECGIAIAAGLAIACSAGIYLTRRISRPLDASVAVARRIADGCLGNGIVVQAHDEFGELLRALAQMDAQIAEVVRQIQMSSESILVAAREIAGGNHDLSTRTEEQAASLEQTAASVQQLAATNHQNAGRAREAMELAADTSRIAQEAEGAVTRMLTMMSDITQSSVKIADITKLIEGIAFQTNILALNAAVEAARAGEPGRGFAVVAGEVRALAQRSSGAAKEIRELIRQSSETVRAGSSQVGEVGRTVTGMTRAIDRVVHLNADISAASDEQMRGLDQINSAMSQLDDATQRNATLVEEATAAAETLEEQANQQRHMLTAFRLSSSMNESGKRQEGRP
ncbi:methyl-accepting chemotaxis protein [Paraburkholderia hospita]|uniref:methyl-accepting chemotaxis protein n=1 Tax=Paraburkholderia hospita TaxID=169430 RepID=UPI003ECF7FF9